MEDNALQKRCEAHNLFIDRSVFYPIGSPEILQLFDGMTRIISKKDPWRMAKDNGMDGLRTITNLVYKEDTVSPNPNDNLFIVHNPRALYINIRTFNTLIPFENDQLYNYDLRDPPRKIINPAQLRDKRNTVANTAEWSQFS